jgi:hypothetical protein
MFDISALKEMLSELQEIVVKTKINKFNGKKRNLIGTHFRASVR